MSKAPKFVGTEMWKVANLIPYELNSKKHPPEQVKALAKLIADGVFDQPIVVDKHGVIVKGHGRRLAVMELGWDEVEVKVIKDKTPDEIRAIRLADNRVAQTDTDVNLFQADIAGIEDMSILESVYTEKELAFTAADLGTINDEAFVSDMGAVVAGQQAEVENRLAGAKGGRVQLSKAFGFKDIPAAGQIVISQAMAKAEANTGLSGDEAFVKWLESLVALA